MFGNIIITFFISYWIFYLYYLLFPKKQLKIVKENKQLEKLRNKTFKTLEEQKKFIGLKYPKSKWKFSWESLGEGSIYLGSFIVVSTFIFYNIKRWWIPLWLAFIIIVFSTLLLNSVLAKIKMQHKDDIMIFFK